MKLLRVKLSNLFNEFNHNIKFNQDEHITILTAPNGYGKTITLKVIYNLFNRKFSFFDKFPFNKIIFFFDDKQNLELIKLKDGVKLNLKKNNKLVETWTYKSLTPNEIKILERNLPPYIEKAAPDMWFDDIDCKMLSTEDIIQRWGNEFPKIAKKNHAVSKKINSIISSLKVYLIQEERLVIRRPQPLMKWRRFRSRLIITDTIQEHSKKLTYLIGESIKEYAQKTQSLDSSFPKRLFKNNIKSKNSDNLNDRLSALEEKHKKISALGLLKLEKGAFLGQKEITREDKKVLYLYIEDSEKKLSVFDSLVDRIELFTTILNKRRLNFKQIEIDKDKGFVFKTNKGTTLELTGLSSGEQHEVVLLFELLFNTKENSLVLIDEPEISLHVVWQKAFLDDIKEIIKLQKIDVIIATHSPHIINEHWSLTVSLDEKID